jgi:hypothetical protein
MMQTTNRAARRGTVIPFLALTIIILVAFLALAIDIGMMTIAKAQLQNLADLTALTAMRTMTGDPSNSYNQSQATTNAQNVMGYNKVLGQTIPTAKLTLTYGTYDYSQSTQTFSANYPGTSGKPYTAASSSITADTLPAAFSSVLGFQFLPSITASAQAVHRPRDIALVMDLSGSMRFGTCLGYDFYTTSRSSNNPDTAYPTFGHYSSTSASMKGPTTNQTSTYDNYTISPSNTTAGNTSYTLTYVNNFYQNAAYASTLVRAFDAYTSTDGGTTWTAPTSGGPILPPSSYKTTPGGDVPLFKAGSTSVYAQNVQDVTGGTTTNTLWELDGYSAYASGQPDTSATGSVPKVWTQVDYSDSACDFNGYTQGPGYYGKTFFLWPPDPRTTTAMSSTTLKSFLGLLGVTDTTDQTNLSSIWSTWQGQGVGPGSTGLTNLQNWLKGTARGGASALPHLSAGNYSPTNTTLTYVPSVTSWNGSTIASSNKPLTYYAVCRLFNRAYPGGSSWSGTTLSSGTSFHADWRMRFFGTTNNALLFNTSGSLALPSAATYTINYNAILSWIASSQDPFPSQLRAGRIKYYSSIPTSITGTWPSYGSTDQRFWKEVIDYTLGFYQTTALTYQDYSALCGYGSDFTWGTVSLNTPPTAPQSMSYTDIPLRPRLRYWFGPMNMVDYLHNYNAFENVSTAYFWQPGDSYEAPQYSGKQGFLGAINTMENNHPNDWFSLAMYSWPRTSSSTITGRFNCVACPMGTNYNYAKSSLFFPFSTINADGSCNNTEVTPYDVDSATSNVPSANFVDTPRPDGDTCFAMGLMLAYNQFALTPSSDTALRTFVTSSPITFPTGMAGGLGRKGAQKVIIFETDGMANCSATASLMTSTTTPSYKYYQIRYDMNKPGTSEYPTIATTTSNNTTVLTQVYSIIDQLAADYGSSRNPFRLYAIGFGPVFQGTDSSSAQTTLQTMQYHAGTQTSASTALPSSQIITGSDTQMKTNLTNAFTTILQSGVQIALIK